MPAVEKAGLSKMRERLVSQATGNVVEIGAGTGLNLTHYRDDVQLTLAEPNPEMVEILRPKADNLGVKILEVPVEGLLEAGLEPNSLDCVVSTLVLCSVADVSQSLEVISKLLVPGGRLLFIEHVVTPGAYEIIQKLANPIWGKLAGGCRLDTDLLGEFDHSSLIVTDLLRFNFPLGRPLIPHGIMGVARPRSDFFG